MNRKELRDKLRKGICPDCGNDLVANAEYGYVHCQCGYKLGFRELKKIQK